MSRVRTYSRCCVVLLSAGYLQINACFSLTGENFSEFRIMAVPGIESGFELIVDGLMTGESSGVASGFGAVLDGVLSGFFEVLEPDAVSVDNSMSGQPGA